MATYLELQTLVANIIQDDSFTPDDIKGYLNRGVSEIAGGMQSSLGSFITPPLPKLFTIGTVDTATDAAYVSMPVTFQRDLKLAVNENGVEISISNSMMEFSQIYPLLNTSGNIYEVCEQGGNLYYQGIPTSSEEITIHFHRLPVDMSAPTDLPDGIPLHLQIPLLVNFACFEIFKLIEDGVGEGVNTAKYGSLLMTALRTLELSIPFETNSLFLGD